MKAHRLVAILVLAFALSLPAQRTVEVTVIVTLKGPSPTIDPEHLITKIGGSPAHVVSVQNLKDQHLQFVLLNDQSGSSKWPAGTAQQAFFEDVLLKTLMVPGVDRGSLLNYNDEFYFDAQNVSDPAVISGKIVRAGRGGTATHDAIVRAGKWLQKQPLNSDGRKLMFLFTDGDVDNASTCSFKPALDEILKTGIPVFVIVPRSSKPLPETSHLADIASKTGGEIYFVGPQDSGTQAFSFLRRELDNSFMITIDVPQEVEKGLQKLSIKTKRESFSVQAPEDIWIDK